MTKTTIEIRMMSEDDIENVLKVDQQIFSASWTEDIYKHEILDNQYAHYFVVEADGQIIGFAGLWIVDHAAQVTNIGILEKYRGYNIGEKLFGFTLQYAINQGVTRLSLEVRISNIVAQKMYRKFGLVPGEVIKEYYTDNGEDALVMWVNFDE